MTPTISLCLIVKNEEDYIEQCLNSVLELVNEIIIIDTGSTDKTKELALDFKKNKFPNLKILDFPWVQDFSSARNFSTSYATSEWILILDADEIIAKEDHNKIKELILKYNKPNTAMGLMLIQRNYANNSKLVGWTQNDEKYVSLEKFSGFYPTPITRLFKNKQEIVFRSKVHESVDDSIFEKKGKIKLTEIPIHHFQYERGEEYVKQKQLNYFDICKEMVKTRKQDFKVWFDMGVISANYRNSPTDSEKFFKQSLELNPHYLLSYLQLATVLEKQNKLEAAITIYKKALSIEKNNFHLVHNLAVALTKTNKPILALKFFEHAAKLNPNNPHVYTNVGCIFGQLGKFKDATEFFQKSLDLNPNDTRVKNLLEGTKNKINKNN
ncbi:glycosyltransferase [Candidatus Woesearchaeota archaeon]|jgi:glycosyltransferase involved in cell wall biosynthesis|nr:glycosyltransferase [Candidatus Woesearchaeota archaeon]